jgi:hypothetical protein
MYEFRQDFMLIAAERRPRLRRADAEPLEPGRDAVRRGNAPPRVLLPTQVPPYVHA